MLTPISGGRLQPTPEPLQWVSDDVALSAQLVGPPTTAHVRVHGDVLVFAQAHADVAFPEDLR
ncbi:hypothetical protein ACGFMK_36085 [Amycolatopsis sp. NPDC049252]|uniref:hypothetical protein n=1 Tax=Amycolatopsis sp. NPDC049252 TaxID=3363933 RepID=UPI00371C8DCE